MSKVTVTLKPTIVKALTLFAAKGDIRYYLNGILVEFVGNDAFLVATNGHRLAAFRGNADGPVESTVQAIVPTELFRYMDAKKSAIPVSISIDENEIVSVTQGQITVSAQAVQGRFPNWRKVVPSQTSGVIAQFNPTLTADIDKVAQLVLGHHSGLPHIRHNGPGGALIDIGDENFVIVVMPFRSDAEKQFKTPEWAILREELVA